MGGTTSALAGDFVLTSHGATPGAVGIFFQGNNALGGGGTGSLRMDPQGKAAAQMLLSKEIAVPAAWLVSGGPLA